MMTFVVGLGNPGPEYENTRHNIGWWVLDRAAHEWGAAPFRREGAAWITEGTPEGRRVTLIKPATYMNRSGQALAPFLAEGGLDPVRDILVVVDDAALDVGRIRLRPRGSPGGHNGLRSISRALETDDYPRLRVGVGRPPDGVDWADWVLSALTSEEEDVILTLLPELVRTVESWLEEGVEMAMSRFNR